MLNQLKKIRIDKGLTQSKLASMSKVSRREIQSIEAQQCNPLHSTLIKLAGALDCLVSDFNFTLTNEEIVRKERVTKIAIKEETYKRKLK